MPPLDGRYKPVPRVRDFATPRPPGIMRAPVDVLVAFVVLDMARVLVVKLFPT